MSWSAIIVVFMLTWAATGFSGHTLWVALSTGFLTTLIVAIQMVADAYQKRREIRRQRMGWHSDTPA